MQMPTLSDADQKLLEQLLTEKLLSPAQLRQLLSSREQAWQAAQNELSGLLCSLEPGKLRLSEFPTGKTVLEFRLEHHRGPDWGDHLLYVGPEDGRILQTMPLPAKPALLITEDGSYWFGGDPSRLLCLGETSQLHGYGECDSDLLLSPKGDLLFVTERFAGRLHVISLITRRPLNTQQIREPGSHAAINLTIADDGRRAFITDQVSSRLYMLDLGSWHLMPLQTGLGTLGNLALAPDANFLYLTVLEPGFRLVYFDLQSLSVIQDLDILGDPASLMQQAPVDLLGLSPDQKRLFFVTSGASDGEDAMLVHVIGTRQVRTVRRYPVSDGSHPIGLMAGFANPLWDFRSKGLSDWVVELGLMQAEALVRFKQAEMLASIESGPVQYEVPDPAEEPGLLLKRQAPPITLPPEADDVLVEMVVKAFYQETQTNLRQHPAEIQRLYQLAIDWRQRLEQRYAVDAQADGLQGRYSLQVLITREALLQEVDRKLEGRELPFRPSQRCPMCQATLRTSRHCEQCGFHLEDPGSHERREKLSAEACSELIPGQMLLALPQVDQLLLLNAWHEIISAIDLMEVGLLDPCHAVALPNRHYLVVDRKGKVVELSAGGELVRKLDREFIEPVMATFYRHDSGNLRILVVDKGANEILEFDFNGQPTCSWGRLGELELNAPRDVQRTWSDTLLISDTGNQRVVEIERSGRMIASWGPPKFKFERPVLARREVNGDTLIVDAGRGQIVAFNESRQLVRNFRYWPPDDESPELAQTPAPDRLLVLNRDLIALSHQYWMQISLPLEQIRWVKPWTGPRRRQRVGTKAAARGDSGAMAMLRAIPFLKTASRELLETLEGHLQPVEFQTDDLIIHQGELGSVMYFLLEGQVEVLKEGKEQPVATLGPGNLFGEMALILSEPRIAGVRAKRTCKLLQLERNDFNSVIEKYPDLAEQLRKLARERKALTHGYNHKLQQEVMRKVKTRMAMTKLRDLAFFTDTTHDVLEALADAMRPVAFMPRHVIFSAGESGDTMYFITRGQVDVFLETEAAPVASLQAGDVFGEMALLLDQERSATIRSDNYCQCFELDRPTFEHISGQHPDFQERLKALAAQRNEVNQDLLARVQQAAAEAAFVEAVQADAAAEIDAALAGAEVFGTAPHMLCHLVSPLQETLLALDGEGQILWRTGSELNLFHPFRAHIGEEVAWIADTGNDRVVALDLESREILREWGDHLLPLSQPRSAVPTPHGNLLICDEGNQRLVLAGASGELLWEYGHPHDIMSPFYAEQTDSGSVLFCDKALHMVFEIDPRSKQIIWSYGANLIAGDGPDELCEPGCVRRLPQGGTLIADTGNNRLLLISPQGQLLRSYRGSPEIPLLRPIHCEMLASGEVMVWSAISDEIVRLDLAGDPVWRAKLPQGASSW